MARSELASEFLNTHWRKNMSHAQMIARAWLDDNYRAELAAKGIEVPARPNELDNEELDGLADDRQPVPAPACTIC